MIRTVPIQFPVGEILDRDAFVWATLPPGTAVSRSRIVGACSCEPSELCLQQVTVECGDWRLDLLSPGQRLEFPRDRGRRLAVPGLEQHDVRARSTAGAPVRVTVHVARLLEPARDERGRVLATPVTFKLVLFSHSEETS